MVHGRVRPPGTTRRNRATAALILWLLAGGYLFGALWVLVTEVEAVTVWNAGLVVVVLALAAAAVGTYRRRGARQ